MKIITISREFGSGGRELGKRLADLLRFDYYDSEIISAVAKNIGMDKEYVEKKLENHGWQSFPITYRGTLGSANYVQSSGVSLLLQQKKVIEEIAALPGHTGARNELYGDVSAAWTTARNTATIPRP